MAQEVCSEDGVFDVGGNKHPPERAHPKHATARLTESSWQPTAPFAISGIWSKVEDFLSSQTISL